MIKKYGKLLGPDEIKKTKSPNTFPIVALFAARKKWEDPSVEEGFESVTSVPFVREHDPTYTNKALILDYDGTLRKTGSGDFFPRSTNDVLILPGRTRKLSEYAEKGYLLLGVSNQSGIHKGDLTLEDAKKCFDRTNELLGHQIDYRFCPHRAAPPRCYCRKPQVGLGIALIEEYKLNPSECIYVGDMTSDKTFAKRCGFQYEDASTFFEGK
jgi:HAD superfamily hydrolase (TIGR01662 family)